MIGIAFVEFGRIYYGVLEVVSGRVYLTVLKGLFTVITTQAGVVVSCFFGTSCGRREISIRCYLLSKIVSKFVYVVVGVGISAVTGVDGVALLFTSGIYYRGFLVVSFLRNEYGATL